MLISTQGKADFRGGFQVFRRRRFPVVVELPDWSVVLPFEDHLMDAVRRDAQFSKPSAILDLEPGHFRRPFFLPVGEQESPETALV